MIGGWLGEMTGLRSAPGKMVNGSQLSVTNVQTPRVMETSKGQGSEIYDSGRGTRENREEKSLLTRASGRKSAQREKGSSIVQRGDDRLRFIENSKCQGLTRAGGVIYWQRSHHIRANRKKPLYGQGQSKRSRFSGVDR